MLRLVPPKDRRGAIQRILDRKHEPTEGSSHRHGDEAQPRPMQEARCEERQCDDRPDDVGRVAEVRVRAELRRDSIAAGGNSEGCHWSAGNNPLNRRCGSDAHDAASAAWYAPPSTTAPRAAHPNPRRGDARAASPNGISHSHMAVHPKRPAGAAWPP